MSDDSLDPQLRTVAELFDAQGTVYTVPAYQRSYSWDATQIEQLISDIYDALRQSEQSYFLGNLVVTNRGSDPADYEVIDGQQRLTTLYLLLTFLTVGSASEESTHRSRLHYESRTNSTNALRNLDLGRANHAETDNDFVTGIYQGYKVIAQYMDQKITGENRTAFTRYLLENVQLVRASLPKGTDFNKYFEVMNTRGEQLQQVDIVKATLMSALSTDAERTCFAWIWDACTDMNSYLQSSLTMGNLELRSQLFDDNWTWLRVSTFDDLLAAHGASSGQHSEIGVAHFPRSYNSMDLDVALDSYLTAPQSGPTETPDGDRFNSTIQFTSLLLHTLKLFEAPEQVVEEEGGLDDRKLIDRVNSKLTKLQPENVKDFITLLLRTRVAFDAFIVKREFLSHHSDDGEWSLQKVQKYRNKKSNSIGYINTAQRDSEDSSTPTKNGLLLLQSMLRITYTSPRTMHWITLVLHHVLSQDRMQEVNETQLIAVLRSYVRNRIREIIGIGTAPEGFNIPRLVFTYLDYLLITQESGSTFTKDFTFSFRTSIEHFYPQNPDEQQSGTQVSAANLHSLGNLALVSVGTNSKFSNSLPHAKASNFRGHIETQSPKLHLMAEATRRTGAWDDEAVQEHHDQMMAIIQRDLKG